MVSLLEDVRTTQGTTTRVYVVVFPRYLISVVVIHPGCTPLSKSSWSWSPLCFVSRLLVSHSRVLPLLPGFLLVAQLPHCLFESPSSSLRPVTFVTRTQCVVHQLLQPGCLPFNPLFLLSLTYRLFRRMGRMCLVLICLEGSVLPPHHITCCLPVHG